MGSNTVVRLTALITDLSDGSDWVAASVTRGSRGKSEETIIQSVKTADIVAEITRIRLTEAADERDVRTPRTIGL